jgi:alpha-beta hydrolase superfamily lysophospholipase
MLVPLGACSNLSGLLFYPQSHFYQQPEQLGLDAERVSITTSDGETLFNWLILAEQPKATVLFLHGNGQNISTHINSVAWLPQHGFNVFLLDYRGYGKSTGSPTLAGAMLDTEAAHQWLHAHHASRPLYLFGQSMGGALAITYAATARQDLIPIQKVLTESAPASWPQVAREAMSSHWLTWALQAPASLMPSEYDAETHISLLSDRPVLLMHSPDDDIVGFHHMAQLLEQAGSKTRSLQTSGPHIAGLADPQIREQLLAFLNDEF